MLDSFEKGMQMNGFIGFDELVDNSMYLDRAEKVPLFFENGERSRYYSVINRNSEKEVCTVSERYGIVQHTDAIERFITSVQSAGIEGYGRIRNFGDTVTCDVIFDNFVVRENKESFDGKGDIHLGATMRNSFNKSVGFSVYPFMLRGVCTNGMIFKQRSAFNRLYVKHIGDVIGKVGNGIKNIVENMFKIENAVLNMIDVATNNVITFEKREDMILTLGKYAMGERRAYQLIEQYDLPLSLNVWDLYQVLTEYASWTRDLKYSVYDGIMEGAETILINGLTVEKSGTPLVTV